MTDDTGSKIPPRSRAIIDAGGEIMGKPPTGREIAFMHNVLCRIGLPRSAVQGREFRREWGSGGLIVQAGSLWDGKKFAEQPVPYGSLPRLMLSHIATHAIRYDTPEIPFGDSLNDAMRLLGVAKSGGASGSYTTFRKQTCALAACTLTLGFNVADEAYTFRGQPIDKFAVWQAKEGEQRSLWPSGLVLSKPFFDSLISDPIPHDWRALEALSGSALAMDIYLWLCSRLFRLTNKSVRIYWHQLRAQFGQEYNGKDPAKDFKKQFIPALRKALAVYPEARVEMVSTGQGGLVLHPSRPAVPERPGRELKGA